MPAVTTKCPLVTPRERLLKKPHVLPSMSDPLSLRTSVVLTVLPSETGPTPPITIQRQVGDSSDSMPTHSPSVHVPSMHASLQSVPSVALQLLAVSLQTLEQIGLPVHGSPWCPLHAPAAQISGPLQNVPSSQGAVLFVWRHEPTPLQ